MNRTMIRPLVRPVVHSNARAFGRVALVLALATWLGAAMASVPPPALAAPSRPGLTGVVNINTATAEELQLLPGVGKRRAAAILELRQARGGFKRVDDLTEVSGIGDAMLDAMRPHVALIGKTTARRGAPGKGDAASDAKASRSAR